ncbi:MAG: 3-dehydroquinate synthase [Candidatus Walczuchella monophlebidarum]
MTEKVLKTIHYTIFFNGEGYITLQNKLTNYSSLFIMTDPQTSKLCLQHLLKYLPDLKKARIFCIPFGEKEKKIQNCLDICRKLNKENADRKSLLINLGGGVITDLGGFLASIFKRGIYFLNIPTTLLAMVDASTGGKTGINLDNLKNEIGVFNYPDLLIIDKHYLKTLPNRELKSGMAELFKYGLIADNFFWEEIKNRSKKMHWYDWNEFIYQSNFIKNNIVTEDPYERKGLRKILNFGHTIGHGIESYFLTTYSPLLHGEAIALGMVCESWISWKMNGLSHQQHEEISKTLLSIYPLREINEQILNQILKYIRQDKKKLQEDIHFSLLREIGICTYNHKVSNDIIKQSFQSLKRNNLSDD